MEHKTTAGQDRDFVNLLFDGISTNDVISAIKDVLSGEAAWVLGWVADNFAPDEVYGIAALEEWADRAGWSEPA